MIKISLLIALIGHVVLGISDCLMSYGKKGRLNMKNITDNEKMSVEYEAVPLSYPAAALATGVYALTAMAFGYLVVAPTKLPAKANIAGSAMFLGLLCVI